MGNAKGASGDNVLGPLLYFVTGAHRPMRNKSLQKKIVPQCCGAMIAEPQLRNMEVFFVMYIFVLQNLSS